VDLESPAASVLSRAGRILADGELIVYPTDTLYAVGGRAMAASVARRVHEAKGRDEGKPLPVVAADAAQAAGLSSGWTELAARLAATFWPGPLSLVVGAAASVPTEVTAGFGSVAVRVPAVRLVRLLCAQEGPLISTSANRTGGPPARTCDDAVRAIGHAVALALDGGSGGELVSTLVDVRGREPRLVRAGAVPWARVLEIGRGGGCC
jgi:L-threonylcarbamoyladenylate synthase